MENQMHHFSGATTVYQFPLIVNFFYGEWNTAQDLPKWRSVVEELLEDNGGWISISLVSAESPIPGVSESTKMAQVFDDWHGENYLHIAGSGIFAMTAKTVIRTIFRLLKSNSHYELYDSLDALCAEAAQTLRTNKKNDKRLDDFSTWQAEDVKAALQEILKQAGHQEYFKL